ncbi:MAG: hypothetical protein QOJ45_1319 [Verrucomicrobiota bacterium]|jgi:hypothetical protein
MASSCSPDRPIAADQKNGNSARRHSGDFEFFRQAMGEIEFINLSEFTRNLGR